MPSIQVVLHLHKFLWVFVHLIFPSSFANQPERLSIEGTIKAETLSANLWMGGFEACARCTVSIILEIISWNEFV